MRRSGIKKIKSDISFYKEPVILLILALVLMNILNYSIYFCYLLLPVFLYTSRKNYNLFDNNLLSIFLFSLLYSLMVIIYQTAVSKSLLVGYLFFPSIFYFLGKYLIGKYPTNQTVFLLLFFICFSFSILPFLANVRSVLEIGFMRDRDLRMFWMKPDDVKSATGIGTYFAINMALLPLVFLIKGIKSETRLAIFSLFLFLIALYSILNMSNRTGLFITVISLIVFIFIPKEDNFKYAISAILFLITLIILYVLNAWNVKNWFEYSLIYERIQNTGLSEEGSRVSIWGTNFIKLIHNPLGYVNLQQEHTYAHNLWLDVGRVAGILPLIPLLIFTISSMITIVKIVFSNELGTFPRVLVMAFGVAFYITFFVEPVIEGAYIMFLVFCFYFGLIEGVRKFSLT